MKHIILLLSLSLVLLGGCSERDASTTGAAKGEGQLVFISGNEHNFLDPQRISWLHDFRIADCLFEPLLRLKLPELTLDPGVAAKWDVSDDGLTYTFHLRPEARWSNGEPVTAGDFVYAWRRILLPDLGADYAQLFFCIEGAEEFVNWRVQQLAAYSKRGDRSEQAARELWAQTEARFAETVGVSAADARTLVVKLARPTHYFLELCAFASFVPLHAASVAASTGIRADTAMMTLDSDPSYWSTPELLVSNGPYVLSRRRFRVDLLLTANEHYWNRAAMGNSSILEKIIAEPSTALLSYQRGEVHWWPDVPTAAPMAADLVAQKRPDVHVIPWAGTYFYNFNCLPTRPDGAPNPLADARVRRALSLAIDRQTVVEKVTRMRQPIARTFVPPGVLPGYESPVEAGVSYDPEAARRLLAEAGHAGGKGLTGLSILYNTGMGHEGIAQQIKRNWEQQLGVVVTLEGVESKMFSERLKRHDYAIARASWIGDYRDATTFLDKFITGNGNNDAAWSNSEFDALMRRAAEEPDATKRLALLAQAEALMLGEQPVACIHHSVTIQLFDPKRVKDLAPNAWNFRRLEMVEVTR